MKTLKTIQIEIAGKKLKLEYNIVGSGQHPKILLFVNGIEWIRVNSCNFKNDFDFELNFAKQELANGSYKMFL
jgi:hypothetical protein